METPNVTKKRIINHLSKGLRFDGRKPLELRKLSIEQGISKKAEGSVRVRLGKTEVLVGIKMALGTPYPDSMDQGTLMVTAEFSPMASEKFEKGPPSINAITLARIVDRGIRECEVIDMKKLCVKEGEKVWSVFVDIYPINDDGNLVDAASLGAMAALKTAVFPKMEGKGADAKVLYGQFTKDKLPIRADYPLTMTFYKVGDNFLTDPTTEEEDASSAKLSVAVSINKKEASINAMQKDGDETLSFEDIEFIVENAPKEIRKLLATFEKALK